MEKRHDFGIVIFNRLLKSFCILLFLFAQKSYCASDDTRVSVENLSVKTKNALISAGEECEFELFIPDWEPDFVRTGTLNLPPEILFKSLKRTKSPGKNLGTQIEFQLVFPKKGDYELPPFNVTIGGKNYSVPFEKITVKENPKNLFPRIIAVTDGGFEFGGDNNGRDFIAEAGKPVYFTIHVQNAAEFISLSWETPKDAVFSEVETYKIDEKDYASGERLPVARFEWIPLKPGKMPLPSIKVLTAAYSGARQEILLPEREIKIVPAKKETSETIGNNLFSRAFETSSDADEKNILLGISAADCAKLSELRSKERHSAMFFSARHERKIFEAALGIKNEKSERNVFILLLSAVAAFLSVFMFFVFLIMHKRPAFIVSLFVSGVLCTAAACYAVSFFAVHAIFLGTEIYSVPEKKSSFFAYQSGKRVRIQNSANGWYYVLSEQGGGWISKDDVIVIK